uniref:PNPLA domain-containing protein n=1 Tax=Chromera velia CCMP2878 TaxID=1169474 RepID=A0A0G4GA01_9ALVE|eukprot:Cvel_20930.t1-p1 / transcript=Cvel_20930.t1 / gene=Cvel_20930 / organism=Chromera_velia_CCMP2878 / gene_product=Patatin-like phospholipase domain-containing, putative / transcript_product=Patatin-like phospholipase domain-containing, putative / location=Cvel_scaffold1921:20738-28818(-) / protein_length=1037 / sequence_SO=supercontig / SO=protein_coding / is_pseudo=false
MEGLISILQNKWFLIIFNIIFSSSFLAFLIVLMIVNKPFRHATILWFTWLLYLSTTMLFAFLRMGNAAYQAMRICFDLFLFLGLGVMNKTISAFQCNVRRNPKEVLLQQLDDSSCYEEWVEVSEQLDSLLGFTDWRKDPESEDYQHEAVVGHMKRLREARAAGDLGTLRHLLRLSCDSNFCNLSNSELFGHARVGTKFVISEYMDEVVAALVSACTTPLPNSPQQQLQGPQTSSVGQQGQHQGAQQKLTVPGGSPGTGQALEGGMSALLGQRDSIAPASDLLPALRAAVGVAGGEGNTERPPSLSGAAAANEGSPFHQLDASHQTTPINLETQKVLPNDVAKGGPTPISIAVAPAGGDGKGGAQVLGVIASSDASHWEREWTQLQPHSPLPPSHHASSVHGALPLGGTSMMLSVPAGRGVDLDSLSGGGGERGPSDDILLNEKAVQTDALLAIFLAPALNGTGRASVSGPGMPSAVGSHAGAHTNPILCHHCGCSALPLPSQSAVPGVAGRTSPPHPPLTLTSVPDEEIPPALPHSLMDSGTGRDDKGEGGEKEKVKANKGSKTPKQTHRGTSEDGKTGESGEEKETIQEEEGAPSPEDDDASLMAALPNTLDELTERIRWLAGLRVAMGRTALCLSGGGALAMYHLGVVKTLMEAGVMPRVISGCSGGSIVAGMLAWQDDAMFLKETAVPDISMRLGKRWFPPLTTQIRNFMDTGRLIDSAVFQETCKAYFKDYTFAEAFAKTGRIVSIVVSPASRRGEPLVLNHVTAPDVLIWSSVAASCALPGLMRPVELYAKDIHGNAVGYFPTGTFWMDGSIKKDIPVAELQALFNVKQFIVSQVNPHHAPFVPTHGAEGRISRAVENWLTMDIKNRYAMLAKFGMVPKIFGQEISSFWLVQEFEGHVTVTPRACMMDWYRVINHPTEEDMQFFIFQGQVRTWPFLERIKHMVKVEVHLRRLRVLLQRKLDSILVSTSLSPVPSSLAKPPQILAASPQHHHHQGKGGEGRSPPSEEGVRERNGLAGKDKENKKASGGSNKEN